MTKVIVFDFDGTIIPNSEALKQEAYYLSFGDYGEKVPTVIIDEVRKKLGGGRGTRFDIFRLIFELLSESNEKIPEKVKQYSERYDEVVKNHTLRMGVPASHRQALESLSKHFPLYVNSIAPEESLKLILKELDIHSLFKNVLGAPKHKDDNLKSIVAQEGVLPSEVLFVGDGENDRQAAEAVGSRFVGFGNVYNHWSQAEKEFPVINDLAELDKYTGNLVDK